MNARPLLLLLFVALFAAAIMRADEPDAKTLVRRVADAQLTSGFTIRAKLMVAEAGSETRKTFQLRIKGRRDDSGIRLLYQILWPTAEKGAALYLERLEKGNLTGFSFTPPDKVQSIGAEQLSSAYLDSDLTIEDLIDDFWRWPDVKSGAEEGVNRENCRIVNLRPSTETKSRYSLIRAWISEEKAVPMRIVKFDRKGEAVKEFSVEKVTQRDKLWFPVSTVIRKPGGTQQTWFEISRGERDVEVPLSDFSVEEIRKGQL
ncbi:MAG TPA: outer membrane lipoprotein-sorting protein [Chthoniobacterales bacterium]|nr:outer membrane lipoprotein-sorting protein [Chthoniobacterales bacterium]